ncbi:hypothetical protein [Candidatus Poriferisodalis sp.]|uniref:hypothetical protein n=1 Tax=Candidatus Poriferisodalis sp. TaxID=3101277 RepID=UPI003AF4278E
MPDVTAQWEHAVREAAIAEAWWIPMKHGGAAVLHHEGYDATLASMAYVKLVAVLDAWAESAEPIEAARRRRDELVHGPSPTPSSWDEYKQTIATLAPELHRLGLLTRVTPEYEVTFRRDQLTLNKEPTEPDVLFERQWNLDVHEGDAIVEHHEWTERILKSDRVAPAPGLIMRPVTDPGSAS